ncbi:hypothetical protein EYZ11_003093 [Aspergillus tanneri]|uniref:O-methyltransferase C-terminal domain-containing protein n=1 Tax=Aspergillus tanneri TaxID=1220188 RepID=A0A4V6RQW9_9EURO|nr:hypothetical protein EYZ11_003093 [Aspergillus tanneri]
MSSVNLMGLASNIEAVAEAAEIQVDEESRKRLLQACDKLRKTLESPFEFTLRVIFAGHQAMALRLGIDMKLFDAVAQHTKSGWKNPNDLHDGPFQYATGTKSHYFDFLASEPYYQQAFNTVMTISHRRQGQNWFNFFPVEEKLRVANDSDILIVDVGGSQGGDIIAFQQKLPHLRGRLVLQDLPIVINAITELPSGIESQGHDFFEEQPMKGARAYYLRTVLHDWPERTGATNPCQDSGGDGARFVASNQ